MKRLVKNIFSGLGVALAMVFAGMILLALSPVLIVLLSIHLYGKLWATIRRDPKQDLTLEGLISEDWQIANTSEDFVSEFKKLSNKIADMAGATQGTVKKEGFSIFDEPDYKMGWADLKLTQVLRTNHAEVTLSFDFGAFYSKDMQQLVVSTEDGDDQCGAGFPPALMHVTKPEFHIERKFTLRTIEDVWMAISILRGDEKFTQSQGQLWSYIPEHKVWLAQYKINESDYGLRRKFTGKKANKYSRDY
jgi:hypothetical protein